MQIFSYLKNLILTPFTKKLEIAVIGLTVIGTFYLGWHLKSIIDQKEKLEAQNAVLSERVKNEDRSYVISTVLANGVDQYAKSVAALPKVSANAMVATIDPAFRLRIQARIYAGERARSGDGKM